MNGGGHDDSAESSRVSRWKPGQEDSLNKGTHKETAENKPWVGCSWVRGRALRGWQAWAEAGADDGAQRCHQVP